MIKLSKQDAKRLLVSHHFQPNTLKGVLELLRSVQYDPLNPIGQNHDLVLQARVPGYSVGDWQVLAYEERFLYDFWDKQASLVLMQDYPIRRIYYKWHAPHWEEKILNQYPKALQQILGELRERGPLSSTEFHHQEHRAEWEGSWYGPKLTKNVLRALWHTGKIQTYRREKGKHVYDLSERVIPRNLYKSDKIANKRCIDWLLLHRHKALGLMRPNAEMAVWSMGISASERHHYLKELVERNFLTAVDVEGVRYHALPESLQLLDKKNDLLNQMRFIGPLDQLIWDRKALAHLFGFDYVWEVYKPEKSRRWGYYVVPVLMGDKFVGRFDSRLRDGVWSIHNWYWETGFEITSPISLALEQAVDRFRDYLKAHTMKLPAGLNRKTREALISGFGD